MADMYSLRIVAQIPALSSIDLAISASVIVLHSFSFFVGYLKLSILLIKCKTPATNSPEIIAIFVRAYPAAAADGPRNPNGAEGEDARRAGAKTML